MLLKVSRTAVLLEVDRKSMCFITRHCLHFPSPKIRGCPLLLGRGVAKAGVSPFCCRSVWNWTALNRTLCGGKNRYRIYLLPSIAIWSAQNLIRWISDDLILFLSKSLHPNILFHVAAFVPEAWTWLCLNMHPHSLQNIQRYHDQHPFTQRWRLSKR